MKRGRGRRLRQWVVLVAGVALLASVTTFKHPTVLNNATPMTAPAIADQADNPDDVDEVLFYLLEQLEDGWADWSTIAGFYDQLDADTVQRLTRDFPAHIANLPGAPLEERIAANQVMVQQAMEDSARWPAPDRPWQEGDRPPRRDLEELAQEDRQLIGFDVRTNQGHGSWVEIVGELDASNVVVMVPGGSAYITSENFNRYYWRAQSFVEETDDLAIIVWAEPPSPAGWIQESFAAWSQYAAEEVSTFVADLRHQMGEDTLMTLAGHSYGGATIGLAEKHPLEVDQVVHIASPGTGHRVSGPEDYSDPCRDRFSMTAPGDPISYVQGLGDLPMMGHGAHPDEFPGIVRLETGSTPDWDGAVDDIGRDLQELGISGTVIEGTHSHSEVFVPFSDAWDNLLSVFTGNEFVPHTDQPVSWPDCP